MGGLVVRRFTGLVMWRVWPCQVESKRCLSDGVCYLMREAREVEDSITTTVFHSDYKV